MGKINKKGESEKLIRVINAIYTLKVSEQHFREWHTNGLFTIKLNKNGQPCISLSDLRKIAYSDFVKEATKEVLLNRIERRQDDEISGRNSIFKDKIIQLVGKYRSYIKTLEEIHSNYKDKFDLINDESALVAAYILHAKAINLLNMACLNLENLYWHSSILIRPIDECIDLAMYFIITENTEEGETHLKAWFRENKAPPHSAYRKAMSKFSGSILKDESREEDLETLSDLYDSKSKLVHPVFNEIIIVLSNPNIKDRKIISNNFDYRECSNLRELYIFARFFQSSIWTTVQSFLICYLKKLILTDSDKQILFELNNKFENEQKISF